MSVKIIYFVHGTTYDNATEKCSGWKQVELNELGKEQAKKLGETTKDLKSKSSSQRTQLNILCLNIMCIGNRSV